MKSIFKKILSPLSTMGKYLLKFFSSDPIASTTRVIFVGSAIIGWVIILKHIGSFTDNDVQVLGILLGGGATPKIAGSITDTILALRGQSYSATSQLSQNIETPSSSELK